jgi:N-acetylmuramoyl-L-alanine amidase
MKVIRKGDRGEEVKALQQALGIVADGIFGPNTEKAVKAWQNSHGLFPDGIVGAKTWASFVASDNGTSSLKKSKRYINKIIVHCTATPEGKEVSVSEIDAWHRARGFAGIGYHYVVHLDGKVEEGRDVDKAGAHTAGYNAHSIGISYVGGVTKDGKPPKDTRTDAQKNALLKLLKDLRRLYPDATIHGHREFANKACPSFDAKTEYKSI